MRPLVVEERQLSNVQVPQGEGRGQGLFSAFSTACSWVMGPPQALQVQEHSLPSQEQLQLAAQLPWQSPGSTGTMLEMTIFLSSSCSWQRQES